VLFVGNMRFIFSQVLSGEAKVDNMDHIEGRTCSSANKKIVRFDITIDNVLGMNVLHPFDL